MNDRVFKVLFVSSGSAATGLMAESILGHMGSPRCRRVAHADPIAIDELWSRGYPTLDLGVKAAEEFARPDSPPLDIVVTVGEAEPRDQVLAWPGSPLTVVWDIPTPTAGDESELRNSLHQVCQQIEDAVKKLVALPLDRIERSVAAARVRSLAA
jgi:arsenate reductase